MLTTLDLRSKGREFDSRLGRYHVVTTGMGDTKVNSAFHPSGVGKLSTAGPAWLHVVKAGRVHLCQVAGNTA